MGYKECAMMVVSEFCCITYGVSCFDIILCFHYRMVWYFHPLFSFLICVWFCFTCNLVTAWLQKSLSFGCLVLETTRILWECEQTNQVSFEKYSHLCLSFPFSVPFSFVGEVFFFGGGGV
uniref:Uncharacterized protein n=1 Tax=Opuntia streptacantha TaxID=393608 RepID=A0A7C8ZWX9_OPUST